MSIAGTEIQPLIFLAVLGAGVVSAFLYAACYVVRYLAGFKKIIETITDLVFVLLSGGVYFAAVYYTGFGEMRIYTVIGFLLGFFALYFLLRPFKKQMPKLKEKLAKFRKLPIINKIFK